MKTREKLLQRFEELTSEAMQFRGKAQVVDCYLPSGELARAESPWEFIPQSIAEPWWISAHYFLQDTFGNETPHASWFFHNQSQCTEVEKMNTAIALLGRAKSDFEKGYFNNIESSITVDVSEDYLSQAKACLDQELIGVAAVIAGAVLEDGLRRLCSRHGINDLGGKPKLNTMNDRLKDVAYEKKWHKKITFLAELRNTAAHGKWSELSRKDVEEMISGVKRFVEEVYQNPIA